MRGGGAEGKKAVGDCTLLGRAAVAAASLLCLAVLFFPGSGCSMFGGGDPGSDPFTYEEIDTLPPEGSTEGSSGAAEDAAEAAFRAPRSVERVEKSLDLALRSISSRNSYRGLWQAARACSWLAENHADMERREHFARRGIAIAREAVRRSPDRVEPYYYLAVNLGRFSGIRKTAKFLGDMARNAGLALEKDEKFDRAGPHRFLGVLHLRTEGKPLVGYGDLDEALRHLGRAVELYPDDPENRLVYAEALIKDESYPEARKHLEAAAAHTPSPELAAEQERWIAKAVAMRREIEGKN